MRVEQPPRLHARADEADRLRLLLREPARGHRGGGAGACGGEHRRVEHGERQRGRRIAEHVDAHDARQAEARRVLGVAVHPLHAGRRGLIGLGVRADVRRHRAEIAAYASSER